MTRRRINHTIRSGNADGVVYHAGDDGLWTIAMRGRGTCDRPRRVRWRWWLWPAHTITGVYELIILPSVHRARTI